MSASTAAIAGKYVGAAFALFTGPTVGAIFSRQFAGRVAGVAAGAGAFATLNFLILVVL